MRVVKYVGVALLLLVAGFAVYLAPAMPVLARWAAWPAAPKEPLTILVAGVSPKYPKSAIWPYPRAPEDFTGLTDTLVLVRFSTDGVKVLSLPRDTRIDLPGWGWTKLNSALGRAGVDGMKDAVEKLTGVRPDHHLLVSLEAARDLVDALGGIDLNVELEMKYTDVAGGLHIDLEPGRRHLDGQTAEGFLRFRHDALGDIGRVGRQQAFLGAVVAKLREPASLLKIPQIARVIDTKTRTDLTRREAGTVAGVLLARPGLRTFLLPGNFAQWGGFWLPDEPGIRALVTSDFPRPAGVARDVRRLQVAVVNVGGIAGAARAVREKLLGQGYRQVTVTNGSATDPEHTVVLSPASLDEAREVAAAVGTAEPRVSAEGEPGADLTVRVGRDFKLLSP